MSIMFSNKLLKKKFKNNKLEKLKYYCEMCSRQCRDVNGFKCHQMSENHKRNMELFTQDPSLFIEKFSEEFESEFLDDLKRNHLGKKILANKFYQEFIMDRTRTHMNSTKWTNLNNFIMHLHKTGKCLVEESDNENGYFITYLDNSPAALQKRRIEERRKKIERKEQIKKIEQQQNMQRSEPKIDKSPKIEEKGEEINIDSGIHVNLEIKFNKNTPKGNVFDKLTENSNQQQEAKSDIFTKKKTNSSKYFEKIIEEDLNEKQINKIVPNETNKKIEKFSIEDPWIQAGLIVRIQEKELKKGIYFGKKAKILKVIDEYIAELTVIENKDILRIDQAMLEPVIPSINSNVKILFGEKKSQIGKLIGINLQEKFVKYELGIETRYIQIQGVCKFE